MPKKPNAPFTKAYPNLANWVSSQGTLELGESYNYDGWLILLDAGGTVYTDPNSDSLEEALQAAEEFLEDEYGEEWAYERLGVESFALNHFT